MKGFRDFYPEDKRIQNWIFSIWKKVAEEYGYEEIEGPILEETKIYSKSGQEIPEQMYTFKDKSGKLLTIRPETTPSIARMIKSKKDLKLPIKWYSISRCLRYERPQIEKGRFREFFQFNLDCIGNKNLDLDAEVITTTIKIMKEFGLSKKDFFVRISNRRLFQDLVEDLEIKNIQNVARILDKLGKITESEMKKELKKEKLSETQIKKLFSILKIKSLDNIKIESEGLTELKKLFSLLKNYGVLDYCKLDLSIMRGFDYYTSTVFEVFDSKENFRSIQAGGRYDDLAGIPGVGYGMSDVVIWSFLKSKNKLPKFEKNVDYFVAPVNEKMIKKAIKISEKLRKEGNKVEVEVLGRNLGKQIKYADSIKAKNLVIVGSKDKDKVTVRDMKTGKEKKVKI